MRFLFLIALCFGTTLLYSQDTLIFKDGTKSIGKTLFFSNETKFIYFLKDNDTLIFSSDRVDDFKFQPHQTSIIDTLVIQPSSKKVTVYGPVYGTFAIGIAPLHLLNSRNFNKFVNTSFQGFLEYKIEKIKLCLRAPFAIGIEKNLDNGYSNSYYSNKIHFKTGVEPVYMFTTKSKFNYYVKLGFYWINYSKKINANYRDVVNNQTSLERYEVKKNTTQSSLSFGLNMVLTRHFHINLELGIYDQKVHFVSDIRYQNSIQNPDTYSQMSQNDYNYHDLRIPIQFGLNLVYRFDKFR